MQVFPIRTGKATKASFASAWNDHHEGTDIFAPLGAEVLAVEDGIIRHAIEKKGGKVVYLKAADGTQYYYSHLDQLASPRLGPGKTRRVRAGEVLGYVGNSGNARGKAPHVHFELRPGGGAKVNPYSYLVTASALISESPSPAPPVTPAGWPAPARPFIPTSGDLGLAAAVLGGLYLLSRND